MASKLANVDEVVGECWLVSRICSRDTDAMTLFKQTNLALFAIFAIGCDKSKPHEDYGTVSPSVTTTTTATSAAATAPVVPPAAPAEPSMEGVNACWLKAADVSAALGGKYTEGNALPAITGVPVRSCTYAGPVPLRVNVSRLTPAMAEAVRKDVTMGMAGTRTPLVGDPDGAHFQLQQDMGTCALHYVKGTSKVELRFMSCKAVEGKAQAMLAKLPRI